MGELETEKNDETPKTVVAKKVSVEHRVGLHSATYIISEEDHTLGNAVRCQLMKDPNVDLCGYTVPHPMERCIRVRVQTNGSLTSTEALKKGLDEIVSGAEYLTSAFDDALEKFEQSR